MTTLRLATLACLSAALCLSTPALAARVTEVPVSVSGAWVREAPPTATALAGYMTIKNPLKRNLTLSGVKSPLFKEVQLHTVSTQDGMMRMTRVPSFTLAAGGTLTFKSGSSHLMLMGPKKALKGGDVVPLVLDFGKDGQRRLNVKVMAHGQGPAPAGASPAPAHDHGHEHGHDGHHH